MTLTFELGDSARPRGHAFVYFTDTSDATRVYATYLTVFPLSVDLAKYVPPFLASSLGGMSSTEISSFPMPPAPEEVEGGLTRLTRLAESRDDDLIFGGNVSPQDVPEGMEMVGEIARQYTEMWAEFDKGLAAVAVEDEPEDGVAVNELMYSLLGAKDRLHELSKLMVKFRFAVEGSDGELREQVADEMRVLAKFLPEEYLVGKIIEAARDASDRGARLAQLYLERCYGLSDNDGELVANIDSQIREVETAQP